MAKPFIRYKFKDGTFEVRIKPEPEYPEAITFPIVEADLTPEVIENCGLQKGLERFGKRLAKQMKVNGVRIHNIGVTFIKEPK